MTHRIRILVVAAVAMLAALASPTVALAQTRLIATVSDPANISLRHADGSAVTDIPAGAYTIEVRDQSTMNNFHLSGPGVDKHTSVSGTGTKTWKVTLRKGVYRFRCDPHAQTMHGSFTVA
jgi:plastocyanin